MRSWIPFLEPGDHVEVLILPLATASGSQEDLSQGEGVWAPVVIESITRARVDDDTSREAGGSEDHDEDDDDDDDEDEDDDDDDDDDDSDDSDDSDYDPSRTRRGTCPACDRGVYTDQERFRDDDGTYWHEECYEDSDEDDEDDEDEDDERERILARLMRTESDSEDEADRAFLEFLTETEEGDDAVLPPDAEAALGGRLYQLVHAEQPEHARKVTGWLLQHMMSSPSDLKRGVEMLSDDPGKLKSDIDDAIVALQMSGELEESVDGCAAAAGGKEEQMDEAPEEQEEPTELLSVRLVCHSCDQLPPDCWLFDEREPTKRFVYTFALTQDDKDACWRVGARVKLCPGGRRLSDAASGPLQYGDVGRITEDDGSSRVRVVKDGDDWYYDREALMLADAPKVSIATDGRGRKMPLGSVPADVGHVLHASRADATKAFARASKAFFDAGAVATSSGDTPAAASAASQQLQLCPRVGFATGLRSDVVEVRCKFELLLSTPKPVTAEGGVGTGDELLPTGTDELTMWTQCKLRRSVQWMGGSQLVELALPEAVTELEGDYAAAQAAWAKRTGYGLTISQADEERGSRSSGRLAGRWRNALTNEGRLQVGDRVTLAAGPPVGGRRQGRLRRGQVAIITVDDETRNPYRVTIDGRRDDHWYQPDELERYVDPKEKGKSAEEKKAAEEAEEIVGVFVWLRQPKPGKGGKTKCEKVWGLKSDGYMSKAFEQILTPAVKARDAKPEEAGNKAPGKAGNKAPGKAGNKAPGKAGGFDPIAMHKRHAEMVRRAKILECEEGGCEAEDRKQEEEEDMELRKAVQDEKEEEGEEGTPATTCPRGHTLVEFEADHRGFFCDGCGQSMSAGSTLHGCRRCDFDLCSTCLPSPEDARGGPDLELRVGDRMELVDGSEPVSITFVDSTRHAGHRVFAIVGVKSRTKARQLVDALNASKFQKPEEDAQAAKEKMVAKAEKEAKAKARAKLEKEQGGWACAKCTFINSNMSAKRCELCESGRKDEANEKETAADSPQKRAGMDLSGLNGLSACLLEAVKPTLVPARGWVEAGGGGPDFEREGTSLPMISRVGTKEAGQQKLQAQACSAVAENTPEVLIGKRLQILPDGAEGSGSHRSRSRSRRRRHQQQGELEPGHYRVISYIEQRKQHLISKLESGDGGGRGFVRGAQVRLRSGYERVGDARHGPLRPGQVGTVNEVDRDSGGRHVHVERGGRGWHYDTRALEVVPAAQPKERGAEAQSAFEDLPCMLVDLSQKNFCLDPTANSVNLNPPSVIAAPGTYLKECTVCFSTKGIDAFAEFCYEGTHITGDSERLGTPRHPGMVCIPCMRHWCSTFVSQAQLFTNCPVLGCKRALQIRELK
eukprot:g1400.t1